MNGSVYADLEVYIMPKREKGYPVQIKSEGREFPKGYLAAEIETWLASKNPERDGEQLYQMLLADGAIRDAWVESRGRNANRRIRFRIDEEAPELHLIPWEIIREKTSGVITKTVAADSRTPFSRYLAGPWEPGQAVRARPLKILVAVANPDGLKEKFGLNPVDVEQEQSIIRDALAGISPAELQITYLEGPVTLSRIEAELQKGYHILHLVGHGFFNEKKATAFFYMADKDNQVQPVSEEKFAEMIGRQINMPQLIFLTSCQTAVRSPADAFRGFAPKLVMAGVPAVVAMQDLVGVAAAQVLEGAFYRRLMAHGRVDLACNEARAQVLSENLPSGWNVPVLFSRLPDGRLLAIEETQSSPDSQVGVTSVQNGQIRVDLSPAQLAQINQILNLSAQVSTQPGVVAPPTTPSATPPTDTQKLGSQLDEVLQAVDAAAALDPSSQTDTIQLGNQTVSRTELLLKKAILLLTDIDFNFNSHLQKKVAEFQQGNVNWSTLPPLPAPDSYRGQIHNRVQQGLLPWFQQQFLDPQDLNDVTHNLANFVLADYDFTSTQALVNEAHGYLLSVNEQDPTNTAVLLQLARSLTWLTPGNTEDEARILHRVIQLLNPPRNDEQAYDKAQALFVLATISSPLNPTYLQEAQAIFARLNMLDWVQQCETLLAPLRQLPMVFEPAGKRWRVDIADQAGSVMLIDFYPNGQFEAVQSGVGFQIQAAGQWGFNPQNQVLQLQGLINGTNPFSLGLTIQGAEGQQFVGVGFDGMGYRFTRLG